MSVKFLNFLVYGEFGAGKTHLIGTANDHIDTSPVLVLDIDGGVTTLKKGKWAEEIDTKPIRSLADLSSAYRDLYDAIEVADDGTRSLYYKTVAIDTISELAQLDMTEIMAAGVSPKQDPEIPSMKEWGKSGLHMREIVRKFRDLPCNVIFTAHALSKQNEATKVTTYEPSLSGKLRQEVPGFLDIVGFLRSEVEGDVTVRKIQFQKTQRVSAKDRTGVLGDQMLDPTIPQMWELIQNSDNRKAA